MLFLWKSWVSTAEEAEALELLNDQSGANALGAQASGASVAAVEDPTEEVNKSTPKRNPGDHF